MQGSFVPGIEPPADQSGAAGWWFAFRGAELLVIESESGIVAPLGEFPGDRNAPVIRRQYLGSLDGQAVWAAELDPAYQPPAPIGFRGLRDLWGALDEPLYALSGRAAQIMAWDRDHQFCGRCGSPTHAVPGERARGCPVCGLLAYPRLAPAVITLIERDDRILLARGVNFGPGRFGIIAGFVESGESLEDAVRREIGEEIGIEVTDVRYHSSQPWPYPHTIMLGFQARWASGEIAIDETEIAEANWYSIDNLPNIPHRMSIARRLIDDWATRQGVVLDQP